MRDRTRLLSIRYGGLKRKWDLEAGGQLGHLAHAVQSRHGRQQPVGGDGQASVSAAALFVRLGVGNDVHQVLQHLKRINDAIIEPPCDPDTKRLDWDRITTEGASEGSAASVLQQSAMSSSCGKERARSAEAMASRWWPPKIPTAASTERRVWPHSMSLRRASSTSSSSLTRRWISAPRVCHQKHGRVKNTDGIPIEDPKSFQFQVGMLPPNEIKSWNSELEIK